MTFEDNQRSNHTIRGVNEAFDALKKSQPGTHCLLEYPDMATLRGIYSLYTKIMLEDNNEIVLILPYYETTDMVRSVLTGKNIYGGESKNKNYSFYDSNLDVNKYENEGSLIIKDSLKGHFNFHQEQLENDRHSNYNTERNMDLRAFLDVLHKHAQRKQKNGITVMSDMGSFYYGSYDHHTQKLMRYEISLPKKYNNMNLKIVCLYHQRDFENRLNLEQQAQLLDCHNRNIMLVNAV